MSLQTRLADLAQAVGADIKALPLYVQSRGVQLVTNGTGLLGDNQNFSGFNFDPSDRPPGASGSFWSSAQTATRFSDELIPVNVEKEAVLLVSARQRVPGIAARAYIGVNGFDVDGNSISASHHMYRANTLTQLASPLNPGDTIVTLVSSANWYNAGDPGVAVHLRSLIFWDYVDNKGYLYPPLTYSRNWHTNAWDPDGIQGNVINLRVPWAGPAKPAGTPLSNGSSGGTYKYIAASNPIIPEEWTEYRGSISGIDTSGNNMTSKYAPGTAYLKLLFLINRTVAGGEQAFARLSLTEVDPLVTAEINRLDSDMDQVRSDMLLLDPPSVFDAGAPNTNTTSTVDAGGV